MRPTTPDRAAGAAPAGAAPADPQQVPKLADGIELLGRFEDSGFVDPPYLARRADGQVVQLTPLLHHVAEASDGRRTSAEVAERVGAAVGKDVTADNVDFLVEEKLRPLGVMAAADGSSPQVAKADPLLALRHRRQVVSERAVWRIAGLFQWLFAPPLVVLVLAGLLAFDVYVMLAGGRRRRAAHGALPAGAAARPVRGDDPRDRLSRGRPRERLPLRRRATGRHGGRDLPRLAGVLLRRHRRLPARPPRPTAHRLRRRSTSTPSSAPASPRRTSRRASSR